jgi:hypothetical protein
MTKIVNYQQLEYWEQTEANFDDAVTSVISSRAALRGLPYGIPENRKNPAQKALILGIFRCLLISWTKGKVPNERSIYRDIHPTITDLRHISDFLHSAFRFQDKAAADYGYAIAFAASGSVRSAEYVTKAARSSRKRFAQKAFWEVINSDCEALNSSKKYNAVNLLSAKALWPIEAPNGWNEIWEACKLDLLKMDSLTSYQIWIDWYERRIRGERAAFDIPGDKRRVEDKKILRRLAEATDEDFWGKGHEYVNATLEGWLDEARERVAPPAPINAEVSGTFDITGDATAELGPLPPPPQNRNVLSFMSSPEGRIAIDATALADQLRTNQGAQDRYDEAVSEAKAALDRCKRSNAGARLNRFLENYLAATGDTITDAKPSLIVQRGERLRQELAAYDNPDSFLDPLADDLLLDLKGWLTAHNMMVGLDPVLNASDLAMLGPDRQPELIPPAEIRQKVEQADEADLLEEGVADTVIEATNLAPEVPDANNRRTIWSIEVVRNLIIESIGIALNPFNVEAQAAAFNAVTGFKAFCGSIEHAKYIVENRDWILKRLGSTPTLRGLIERLADRLEAITPFVPNQPPND